jgi:hypothetical protein
MSQNLRVALWVPIANPGAVGNLIKTTNVPTVNKRVPSAFAADIGGGSGGGIEEAPINGSPYSRKDAGWVLAGSGPGGGVPEAPYDNASYGRQNEDWVPTLGLNDLIFQEITGPVGFNGDNQFTGTNTFQGDVDVYGLLTARDVLVQNPPTQPEYLTNKAYVDAADAGLQTNINAKADRSYVDAADAGLLTNINTKASTTYVDAADALKAPLASPVFTGNPSAPTPTAGDNDTSIATTAFVTAAVATIPAVPVAATVAPLIDATPAVIGSSAKFAREDHVHPTDTSRAAVSALPVAATAAEYIANSAPAKMVTPGAAWGAAAQVPLTDGATVTPNLSLGIDFSWALGAAGRTLANPTNGKAGQKGLIFLSAGASGTITTWGTSYKFPGGTKPTLTPNGVDVLSYVVGADAVTMYCTLNAAFA